MLGSCQQTTENANNLPTAGPDEDYIVTISTSFGDMKAILHEQTPEHKANFLKLANEGFYDGLLFHRIINGFMVQGGDPLSKNADASTPLGMGDPGYKLPAEFHPQLIHRKGALSAARKGDQFNPEKKSNGSQFFIVQGSRYTEAELRQMMVDVERLYVYFDSLVRRDEQQQLQQQVLQAQLAKDQQKLQQLIMENKEKIEQIYQIELDKPLTSWQLKVYTSAGGYPSLDSEYTVFGQVIEGLEIIDQIAAVKTGSGARPVEDVPMQVSVKVMKKNEITEQFGYDWSLQ